MSGSARLRARSDDALRAMAARGDPEAFGTLYERHRHALYRYCLSILANHDDARDAVHEAMAKAWAAIRRAEPDAPLRPWLFRIAHNEALNVLRDRHDHGHLDDAKVTSAESLEETIDLRQRLAMLRADLGALPQRQRSALLLRELCGLRHTEIAVVLAITPAAARQTIYEARVGLHEAEAGRQMACVAVQRALSDGDGSVRRRRSIRGHLRACPACASFDAALRRRPSELAALVGPLPASQVGLLARVLAYASSSGDLSAITKLGSGLATNLAVGSVVVTVGTVTTLESSVRGEPIVRAPAVSAVTVAVGGATRPYLRAEVRDDSGHRAPEHAAPTHEAPTPPRPEAPAAPAPVVHQASESPAAPSAGADAVARDPAPAVTVEADADAAPAKPITARPAPTPPPPVPGAPAPSDAGREPQAARPAAAAVPAAHAVEAQPASRAAEQPASRAAEQPGSRAAEQPARGPSTDPQPDRTPRTDPQPDHTPPTDPQPDRRPSEPLPAERPPAQPADPAGPHADRTPPADSGSDRRPADPAPAAASDTKDTAPTRAQRDPDPEPRSDAPRRP